MSVDLKIDLATLVDLYQKALREGREELILAVQPRKSSSVEENTDVAKSDDATQ